MFAMLFSLFVISTAVCFWLDLRFLAICTISIKLATVRDALKQYSLCYSRRARPAAPATRALSYIIISACCSYSLQVNLVENY